VDLDWCRAIVVVPAREDKRTKNHIHFDLAPDEQQAEVERLIELGARRIDIGQADVARVVLSEPEGNEFCVLPPRPQ